MADTQLVRHSSLTRFVADATTAATKDVFGPWSAKHHAQIGSQTGAWNADAVVGENQILLQDLRQWTRQVFPAEVMNNGDRLYWHDASQVYTKMPTDAPAGHAVAHQTFQAAYPVVKEANQPDVWMRVGGERAPDTISTFDFALTPSLTTIAASPVLLRNYSTDSLAIPKEGTVPARVVTGTFWHDGNVAAGAATIALGTTPGGVDIMAATLVTTLVALGVAYTENAITIVTPGLAVPAVYMTVAVADVTAGKFRFKLVNGA